VLQKIAGLGTLTFVAEIVAYRASQLSIVDLQRSCRSGGNAHIEQICQCAATGGGSHYILHFGF
jgi:hypothetical protein